MVDALIPGIVSTTLAAVGPMSPVAVFVRSDWQVGQPDPVIFEPILAWITRVDGEGVVTMVPIVWDEFRREGYVASEDQTFLGVQIHGFERDWGSLATAKLEEIHGS